MTIEVGAEFLLSLDHKVNEIHMRQREGTPKPIRKPVGGSLIIPAGFSGSGPVTCIMTGYPSVGRVWNILRLGVFGPDPHTAVANVTADFYAGNFPDPQNPVFLDVIQAGMAVPSMVAFAKEVEWCPAGASVFALFNGSGLAAGQQYEIIARVAEYNVLDVETRHIP